VPRAPLRTILRDLKAACAAGDPARVVPCDMAFHRFIIDQAHCPKLLPMWQPIVSRMMLHYTRHSEWMDSYREHEAIADAIFSNHPEDARRLLLANIT
jgi:DNA-binding GntR family transcriptional regulator